jgi:uncharacterized SAM-binding protein YcdF (DUF218 family)
MRPLLRQRKWTLTFTTLRRISGILSGCMIIDISIILVLITLTIITIVGYQVNLPNSTFNMNKEESPIVVVIVLGEMLVNGTIASINLQSRIATAKKLIEKTKVSYVIFSGGDTARVNKTEALVMKELWEQDDCATETTLLHSDSSLPLILENNSLSTCQNAYYSIPILEQIGKIQRIIVVTSDYHVARARLLFEQVFQTVNQQLLMTCKLDMVAAPTIQNEIIIRENLFHNERYWLQPHTLEKLLTQLIDVPFDLPTSERIQQARIELESLEYERVT